MRSLIVAGLVLLVSACSTVNEADGPYEPLQDDPSRRSFGRMLDDETIETRARVNLRKADEELRQANLVIVSFNGIVLLAGQVSTPELRQRAGDIAGEVRYVRRVHNELEVTEPNDFGTRSNDAWITTRIKSRMLFSTVVDPAEVKVVTESGVVYLMGHVDQKSADKAVDMARHTNGVQRVVRMFEYIEE